MEYLPGNTYDRIRELREANGLSCKDVAIKIGISAPTYGRMEQGKASLGHEELKKLAELYNVSADFILGISQIPERTYYDIGELGLDAEAAGNLYMGKLDRRSVNALLKSRHFMLATRLMGQYFDGYSAAAVSAHNQVLDFAAELVLEDGMKNPELKDEAGHAASDIRLLKEPVAMYDMDRISHNFMEAVKEIKNASEQRTDINAQKDFNSHVFENMKEEFKKTGKDIHSLKLKDIMAAVFNVVRKAGRDEEETDKLLDVLAEEAGRKSTAGEAT